MTSRLLIICFCIFSLNAFATGAVDETELHRMKAQKYIDAKDWAGAETEAKAVTDAVPQDKDAWLVYGIVEQRLEHNAEASRAYRKYLDMNPPEDKATAVKQRLSEVEIRADKQEKVTTVVREEKYGSRSNGVFLGFSPLYKPSTSDMLDGGISNNFEFGFQISHFLIGFLYAKGSIPSLYAAPQGSASKPSPVFSKVGPATLTINEIFFDYNIPLTEPYASTGPFSIFIPIHFGGFMNTMKLDSGNRTFSNLGYDAAAGLGIQWFNRSPFTLGASALGHYGIPFSGIHEDADSPTVRTAAGKDVTGGNSCFEIKLTATFLFGYEKNTQENK